MNIANNVRLFQKLFKQCPSRLLWSPITFTFPGSASQTWLLFNLQYLGQYLSYYIQTWQDDRLMDAIIICSCSFWWPRPWCNSQLIGKDKYQSCTLSETKQAISNKLAATVGHFLRDLDFGFANVYMAWPLCFFLSFLRRLLPWTLLWRLIDWLIDCFKSS